MREIGINTWYPFSKRSVTDGLSCFDCDCFDLQARLAGQTYTVKGHHKCAESQAIHTLHVQDSLMMQANASATWGDVLSSSVSVTYGADVHTGSLCLTSKGLP